MVGLNCQQEVDVAMGPFVIRLERQDIGIGGIMGTEDSSILIKYPQSIYKSIYATVEPFNYEVLVAQSWSSASNTTFYVKE